MLKSRFMGAAGKTKYGNCEEMAAERVDGSGHGVVKLLMRSNVRTWL